MATKRPRISFPELEPKGRHAILRTAEEVAAEEEMLASQNAGIPASQEMTEIPTQKVSYRVHPQAVDAVEEMKRTLQRQYGIKASRERIAEAAILVAYDDMLANQQTSKLASHLSSNLANQNNAHGE